ncbi:MAG: hypothetical protein LUD15_15415 [Bacteroides sp.]|nr:hypothetical protein [Bacteroides sp.]
MSEAVKQLLQLPEELQNRIRDIYGNTETFYATVYLIARNEHIGQEDRSEAGKQRMEVIHAYQKRIERMLTEGGVDGKELMADIAGDYLEDYVNYREQDFGMTNEEFLNIIRKIN